jgi:hypothetical protein
MFFEYHYICKLNCYYVGKEAQKAGDQKEAVHKEQAGYTK